MKRTPLRRKSPLRSKPRRAAREARPPAENPSDPQPARRRRGRVPADVRAAVVTRDEGCCRNCGSIGTEVHHIKFRSGGGKHVVENLVLLCYTCHHGHEGPHQSKAVRRRWEEWAADLYRLTRDAWNAVVTGKAPSSFKPQEDSP